MTLTKLTHAANTIEAWKDWNFVARRATDLGFQAEATVLAPPSTAGHRTIDRRIAKLRHIVEKAGLELPRRFEVQQAGGER